MDKLTIRIEGLNVEWSIMKERGVWVAYAKDPDLPDTGAPVISDPSLDELLTVVVQIDKEAHWVKEKK